MVWLDNIQTLESSQVKEIDCCLKKVNLHDVDDPIMLIQNTNTGKYEVGGIRDYKYEDTSAFWRDGASKWDMVKLGTLDLPFPEGKRIHIKNLNLRTHDFTKKFRIFQFMRVFENTSFCPCPLMNRRNR